MKKKTIISIIISIALLFYSCTCFASNEVVGGVTGNVLNNTENVVGDVVNGVGSAAEGVINGVSNVAGDIGNGVREGAENMGNYVMPDNSLRTNTTDEYNATTENTAAANTFLGLNTTAWWWVIIGAICVLLIILVWNRMNNDGDSDD